MEWSLLSCPSRLLLFLPISLITSSSTLLNPCWMKFLSSLSSRCFSDFSSACSGKVSRLKRSGLTEVEGAIRWNPVSKSAHESFLHVEFASVELTLMLAVQVNEVLHVVPHVVLALDVVVKIQTIFLKWKPIKSTDEACVLAQVC